MTSARPAPAHGAPGREAPARPTTDTAVIIVNYRTKELTGRAIASVLREPEVREIVVVDNASGDGSAEHLREAFRDDRVRVVRSERNRGFGPGVNLGAGACASSLMLILNSDATVAPRCVGHLAAALLADDRTGLVAPAVHDVAGGELQEANFGRLPTRWDLVLGNGWARGRRGARRRDAAAPDWVSGVAMLLRRADFLALGGFDEGFEMYFEDLDLCRRLRAMGKRVLRDPGAVVLHGRGESWQSRRDQKRCFHQSKLRYYERLGASSLELGWIRLGGFIRTWTAPPRR